MKMLNTNKRYCVVGTGLTGLATVRYLLSKNCTVELLDTRVGISNNSEIEQEFSGVPLSLGNLDTFVFTASDILIVSPGIALNMPFIVQAKNAGATISSDIELFHQQNTKTVVAVTGSNGKSTVVSLLAHVLNDISVKSIAVGNIGLPVLQAIDLDIDVFVLELSSFQLERLSYCPSAVACVLNLSEDHMDRYDSMSDYAKTKQLIYKDCQAVVVNSADALTQSPYEKIQFSFGRDADFSYQDNNGEVGLYFHQHLMNASELTLKGTHNIENVLSVLAILEHLINQKIITCSLSDCFSAIQNFAGLAHRCQFIARVNGVDYINDSKATNVGASLAALTGLQDAYSQITILLGGVDKSSDFSELVTYIAQHDVKAVLYGKDANVIAQFFQSQSVTYQNVDTMQQAFVTASEKAPSGSAVLLAPACASFDAFKDFSARGTAFIHAVEALSINQGVSDDR